MNINRVVYKISPCKSCACCPTCDIFNAVGPEAVSRCDHYTPIVEVAQWIERLHEDARGDYHLWHCSRCDNPSARKRNFCAECGAKMEVKVAHGRWENITGGMITLGDCSECKERQPVIGTNYCRNCGVKMEG